MNRKSKKQRYCVNLIMRNSRRCAGAETQTQRVFIVHAEYNASLIHYIPAVDIPTHSKQRTHTIKAKRPRSYLKTKNGRVNHVFFLLTCVNMIEIVNVYVTGVLCMVYIYVNYT